MRLSALLFLAATGVCALAQKPPAATTPAAPASPGPPTPTMTGPDGTTLPLTIVPQGTMLPPDRVIVRVGDIQLTAGQLDQILEAYPENQRVFVNGPGRQQFIEQLVRVLMLSQEGKRRKLDQSDSYRNQVTYVAAGVLANHTEGDIRKSIKIDDAMLQEYLQAHRLEYMQLRVRHILIRTQGSPAPLPPGEKDLTEAEALAKAQEIRKKITGGANFAELASTESSDVATRSNGGDLGFFKRGQLPPSFEEAAFALKTGEVSQPVKTGMGYTLIKLEETKPVKSFEELRPEMEKNLRNELARKFVEDLKALTKIEIDPEFASPSQPMSTVKARP
jgi:peptidyl-prolyl cis-trans isomerase C